MNPETITKAIELVRSSWPQQDLTDRAEQGWRLVLADTWDITLARKTLDELAAYRKGRPAPAEFAELYKAKLRQGGGSTVNLEPLPDRDASVVSREVERCKQILVDAGARYPRDERRRRVI